MVDPYQVTDWHFLEGRPDEGRIFGEGIADNSPIPPALQPHARRLLEAAEHRATASPGLVDFRVLLDGHSYRVHVEPTVEGPMFMFRYLGNRVARLNELESPFPETIRDLLLAESLLSGGLVIIAGRMGQGKSTTISAAVVDRLHRYGGLALAIEDPPETPMHGPHGAGYCYQVSFSGGRDGSRRIDEVISASLRCFPTRTHSILMLGEIRDQTSAEQVFHIATSGHLVLMTMHAAGIVEAIFRLLEMAGALEDEGRRRSLASCLRLVVYQQLVRGSVKARALEIPGGQSPPALLIQRGKLAMLRTEIERQENLRRNRRTQ